MDGSKYEKNDGITYKFIGGKVTLSNTKLAATIDAAAGSKEVVIGEGSVKIGGEPINIKSLTIVPSVETLPAGKKIEDIVDSVKVYIDDEPFESVKNWEIKDILIENDADIKVVVDLEDSEDFD
jgi:hypothetical protein